VEFFPECTRSLKELFESNAVSPVVLELLGKVALEWLTAVPTGLKGSGGQAVGELLMACVRWPYPPLLSSSEEGSHDLENVGICLHAAFLAALGEGGEDMLKSSDLEPLMHYLTSQSYPEQHREQATYRFAQCLLAASANGWIKTEPKQLAETLKPVSGHQMIGVLLERYPTWVKT